MDKQFPITLEHPDYAAQKATIAKYRDLYAGGEQFKANASQYLVRRQKEPYDVYSERLARVFYENYAGSIVDWYSATLFRREALVTATVEGGQAQNDPGSEFFGQFVEDCDMQGTNLNDFFRQRLTEALVMGSSWILADFPRFAEPARNRADEEARGGARAYLMAYTPEEVINWSRDERGNLEWAVIRTQRLTKLRAEDSEWTQETRWTYFDREKFRIYRQETSGSASSGIEAIDEGPHGMAGIGRVPLFQLKVSDGLWLMNKAALLQLEHFNKSNALAWAITMGLFAMPVIYSERDWNQIVGESYFIQLGPDDKFGWTEPEGHVYQLASENLGRLQREIYRVCYLLSQAGGGPTQTAPQSGLSKQRDFAITQEVLRGYGDVVKDTMTMVLRAVASARADAAQLDVSGLDEFDIGDFSAELDDAERLLKLDIGSATLKEEVFKKLALKYLADLRQPVKDRIAHEIEQHVAGGKS